MIQNLLHFTLYIIVIKKTGIVINSVIFAMHFYTPKHRCQFNVSVDKQKSKIIFFCINCL